MNSHCRSPNNAADREVRSECSLPRMVGCSWASSATLLARIRAQNRVFLGWLHGALAGI